MFLCVRRIVICLKTVMLVSLLLCWVVDWYCQAHPRSVCQSDEYLRVEKIPSLSCLVSLLSVWRGFYCIWPCNHLSRVNFHDSLFGVDCC